MSLYVIICHYISYVNIYIYIYIYIYYMWLYSIIWYVYIIIFIVCHVILCIIIYQHTSLYVIIHHISLIYIYINLIYIYIYCHCVSTLITHHYLMTPSSRFTVANLHLFKRPPGWSWNPRCDRCSGRASRHLWPSIPWDFRIISPFD